MTKMNIKLMVIIVGVAIVIFYLPNTASSLEEWTTIEGSCSYQDYGERVAVGDLDNDGFDDLIIGDNDEQIHIFYGRPGSFRPTPSPDSEINNCSYCKFSAIDVNGDGSDDLIIFSINVIYAFYGGSRFPATLDLFDNNDYSDEIVPYGPPYGQYITGDITNPGDVNGDGIDDVLIRLGNPGNSAIVGYYGSPTGLPADHNYDWFLEGSNLTDTWFWVGADPWKVPAGGPIGRDGHYITSSVPAGAADNFVWGAPYAYLDANQNNTFDSGLSTEVNSGAVVIYPRGWILTGDNVRYSMFGHALGSAGDINGDGHPDFLASANKTSTTLRKVFLYLGDEDRYEGIGEGATAPATGYAWAIEESPGYNSDVGSVYYSNSSFGSRVGSAGDINGDGYGDIFISDLRFDTRNRDQSALGYWGAVFLYYGGPSSASDPSGLGSILTPQDFDERLLAKSDNGLFGDQVVAGDFNGDGYSDLAVGDQRGGGWCGDIVEAGIVRVYMSDFSTEDQDGDMAVDSQDNCPTVSNRLQYDSDEDGVGNACDNCPNIVNADQADSDGDGIGDVCDNCLDVFNPDQADSNGDGIGDACEAAPPDTDGDGIEDAVDNCPLTPNADQADSDGDGIGDACEGDLDGDGDVDLNDISIINSHRGEDASVCPACDLDGDGVITALDARNAVLLCTRPRCTTED